METANPLVRWNYRCFYRQAIFSTAALIILCTFWFASRYPALLLKSQNLGMPVASMAFDHAAFTLSAAAGTLERLYSSSINWLLSMAIGMTFGVLFGALLHTVLRYYPLKVGKNLYLNSLKGALIGAPMGVCVNCSVPMMCGITRGKGRIEMALGYLFSSPNFNPVVVMMSFTFFQPQLGLVKYAILLGLIAVGVPLLIGWLEKDRSLEILAVDPATMSPLAKECTEEFSEIFSELSSEYLKNVWMLLKPTLSLMLAASILAALFLNLIRWDVVLSHMTVLSAAWISFVGVFMPVPIALDVMFSAQIQRQGVSQGYVMLFLMTLGTYSIVPAIYLWREVSRRLAVILFAFFWAVGFICALSF